MNIDKNQLIELIKNTNELWHKNPDIKFDTADKMLNMRYRSGDQWIGYDKSSSMIVKLDYDMNISPVTANLFKPYSESVKARILSLQPRPRAVPMTRDWSDWTLALNYTKFFKGILNNIDFDDQLQDMTDIMLICKGVWVRGFWNTEITNGKFKGEVDVDIRHDLMAVVDPLATKPSKIRYINFIEVYALDYINTKYKKSFKPDNLEKVLGGWLNTVYSELRKAKEYDYKHTIIDVSNPVVVNEFFYYDKDNKTRVAIFAKGEILEDYAIDFFPIYIPFFKNGLYWQGLSPLSDLRLINRELNWALTRMKSEYQKVSKMLVNRSLVELSDDRETFDFDSSEIVEYMTKMPNAKPEQWMPPPAKTIDISIYLNMWGEVGGQSDASRGKVPTSQSAGVLVESLVQQDETKIGNAKTNLKVGIRKLFKQIKSLVDKYYTEDRIVAVAGRERGWESFTFKDFKDRATWFDIDIEIGSALPTTSGARINTVARLVQMGIFNDLQNPMKHARDLMDLSVFEVDIVDQDIDKQNVEIEQIIRGETPAVHDFDDHISHLKVMLEFQKTADFERMKESSKKMFYVHREGHTQVMKDMMRQQAQAAAGGQMAGMQPPPTQPSQPRPPMNQGQQQQQAQPQ